MSVRGPVRGRGRRDAGKSVGRVPPVGGVGGGSGLSHLVRKGLEVAQRAAAFEACFGDGGFHFGFGMTLAGRSQDACGSTQTKAKVITGDEERGRMC